MCEYEAGLRASLQARLADEQRSQREREAVWRRKLEEAERARSAYTCRVLASQREGLEQQHRAALQAAFERHASELQKRQKEFDEREAALVESLEAAHRSAGRRDAAETDKVRAKAAAYACRVLASQREGMEKILADRHAHERRALELELRKVRERLASVSPPRTGATSRRPRRTAPRPADGLRPQDDRRPANPRRASRRAPAESLRRRPPSPRLRTRRCVPDRPCAGRVPPAMAAAERGCCRGTAGLRRGGGAVRARRLRGDARAAGDGPRRDPSQRGRGTGGGLVPRSPCGHEKGKDLGPGEGPSVPRRQRPGGRVEQVGNLPDGGPARSGAALVLLRFSMFSASPRPPFAPPAVSAPAVGPRPPSTLSSTPSSSTAAATSSSGP